MLLLLISLPTGLGHFDVAGLPFFRSADQEDHEFFIIEALVHAVSGTEVDSKFGNALPYPFVVAEVSQFDPVDARLDTSSNLGVLVLKPLVKVVRTVFCYVVNYSEDVVIVAYWLQNVFARFDQVPC